MREVLDVGPGGLHPVQATARKEHAAKVGQCTSCPDDGALIQLQLSREKGTPGIQARKWGIRSRALRMQKAIQRALERLKHETGAPLDSVIVRLEAALAPVE